MRDIIADIYYGDIHSNIQNYPKGSKAARLFGEFLEAEDWLTEHLDGTAKSKFLNLIDRSGELDGLLSYENFRKGFLLGAAMVMEVCYGGTGEEE